MSPHKMTYYLERRDPEFEHKIKDILCVCKEVNLQDEATTPRYTPSVINVSVDEKTELQAIKNIAPDIMPGPGIQTRTIRLCPYAKHGSWLNLVETFFSKMARPFLKHVRLNSKSELKESILTGFK